MARKEEVQLLTQLVKQDQAFLQQLKGENVTLARTMGALDDEL